MLVNDFFTIDKLEKEGGEIRADLVINADHKIFEGHFPGHPVVPGVCMMQMVKEIIEKVIGERTDLVRAGEMKFLAIINPKENNMIRATLKYNIEQNGNVAVSATFFIESVIHFKFKGLFAEQPHS